MIDLDELEKLALEASKEMPEYVEGSVSKLINYLYPFHSVLDLISEIRKLREVNSVMKEAVQYLVNGAEMVLEANEDGIECRADEDCDHCVLVSAIHNAKAAKIMGDEK